jgi:hypothetical protein
MHAFRVLVQKPEKKKPLVSSRLDRIILKMILKKQAKMW